MNKTASLSNILFKPLSVSGSYKHHVCMKRALSTSSLKQNFDLSTKTDLKNSMDRIEELFSTAKDELEYAQESQGTTYYHNDKAEAEKAVSQLLDSYNNFLHELPSEEMRNEVQTKVGMKMKELKLSFDSLPDGH